MAQPLQDHGGSSNAGAIPLADLRDAVRNIQGIGGPRNEESAGGEPQPASRLHDFIATDNGIAGAASTAKRAVGA